MVRKVVGGYTIDGSTSQDLDDAIDLVRSKEGWWVSVSVADVADSIAVGSSEDLIARSRIVTEYAGRGVRRFMLPQELVSVLSLRPGMNRPCITASIELNASLDVKAAHVERTLFRSSGRLTYEEIPDILNEDSERGKSLRNMQHLATQLRRLRLDSGAVVMDDDEDPHRHPGDEKHPGELIVSEFMVLANASLATFCCEQNLPALYRNHLPTVDDVETFDTRRQETTGLRLDLRGTNMRQELYERAFYEDVARGHVGLALRTYGHFTSPLRRYVDIVNQRALLGLPTFENLTTLGEYVTAKSWNIIDRRTASFRDRNRSLFDRMVAQTDERGYVELTQLSPKEFSRAIERGAARIGTGGILDRAILSRRRNLALCDLARILFVEHDASRMQLEILSEVIERQCSVQIVNLAKMLCEDVETAVVFHDERDMIFHTTFECEVHKKVFQGQANGQNKATAKRRAAEDFLRTMIDTKKATSNEE